MKPSRSCHRLLVAMLLLCCGTALQAQDEGPGADSDESGQPRRYTVEVVIFRYAEDVAVGSERFYPDDEAPEDENAGPLDPDLLDEITVKPFERQIDFGPYFGQPPKFVLLGDDDYTMTRILDQLDRLDVYQTIMHFGWTQLTFPDEPVKPVPLRAFGDPPAGLDGSFTLYLTRYLHLVVDLSLAATQFADTDADDEPRPAFGSGASRFGFGGPAFEATPPVYYRISENRIVRNGDLRYFDNPKFGVVVKLTRVEDSDPEAGRETALSGIAGQ